MNAASRGECLWIVTDDGELRRRAEEELGKLGCRVRHVAHEPLDTPAFWKGCPRYPGAVLLDVGDRLDWAMAVVRRMKRARVPSPVIVATADPSREFGTKIVSLGVSYILPRDFAPGELSEVFTSLVRPHRGQAESEGPGAKAS